MFVVFEGLDGSGKSTLMRSFFGELNSRKIEFVETQDPGGSPLGNQIRKILLDTTPAPHPSTELLLYEASRSELVTKVILPGLAEQKWVICDRFFPSTVAFQGYARNLDLEVIDQLNEFATSGLSPDLIVWVNTPVDVCQERLMNRDSAELNRLDREALEFHQKVQKGYAAMKKSNKGGAWLELDGTKSPEELLRELVGHVFA